MESARPPHGYAGFKQRLFQVSDGMRAEMKDRGGQGSVCLSGRADFNEVLSAPRTSGGDYRNGKGSGYSRSERAVKAHARAVTVHGRQQDFAGAALFGFANP